MSLGNFYGQSSSGPAARISSRSSAPDRRSSSYIPPNQPRMQRRRAEIPLSESSPLSRCPRNQQRAPRTTLYGPGVLLQENAMALNDFSRDRDTLELDKELDPDPDSEIDDIATSSSQRLCINATTPVRQDPNSLTIMLQQQQGLLMSILHNQKKMEDKQEFFEEKFIQLEGRISSACESHTTSASEDKPRKRVVTSALSVRSICIIKHNVMKCFLHCRTLYSLPIMFQQKSSIQRRGTVCYVGVHYSALSSLSLCSSLSQHNKMVASGITEAIKSRSDSQFSLSTITGNDQIFVQTATILYIHMQLQ